MATDSPGIGRVPTRSFEDLARDLERRFAAGLGTPWPEAVFEGLALEAFRLQFESYPAYRSFCEARGCTPTAVPGWREVPAVPATAFKHLDFCVTEPELVFRTSGTTRGASARGRHLAPRAELYRASLLPSFEAHLLPERERIRFVSLIPSPEEVPDSSLSYMVGSAAESLSTATLWAVDGAGVLDEGRLLATLGEASDSQEPILLLGTALALLHWVERLEAHGAAALPPGSRIMETGGFKGLDREIGRTELYGRVASATGVPEERIISEYGMTELFSQLYTPVLSEGAGASESHVPPPWLKVRALDPVTLEEVPEGESGILAFFDLANAGSLCHVLTEDFGRVVGGRVHLEGRLRGAEPRGCSRAMDELMASVGPGT